MVRDDFRHGIAAIFLSLISVSAALAQTSQTSRLLVDQILRPANAEVVQGGAIQETNFGHAVAARDNVALLGIPGFGDPDGPDNPAFPVGRVGVWTFNGTEWQRSGTIDPPSGLQTEFSAGVSRSARVEPSSPRCPIG